MFKKSSGLGRWQNIHEKIYRSPSKTTGYLDARIRAFMLKKQGPPLCSPLLFNQLNVAAWPLPGFIVFLCLWEKSGAAKRCRTQNLSHFFFLILSSGGRT
jgi:hypothetical protein